MPGKIRQIAWKVGEILKSAGAPTAKKTRRKDGISIKGITAWQSLHITKKQNSILYASDSKDREERKRRQFKGVFFPWTRVFQETEITGKILEFPGKSKITQTKMTWLCTTVSFAFVTPHWSQFARDNKNIWHELNRFFRRLQKWTAKQKAKMGIIFLRKFVFWGMSIGDMWQMLPCLAIQGSTFFGCFSFAPPKKCPKLGAYLLHLLDIFLIIVQPLVVIDNWQLTRAIVQCLLQHSIKNILLLRISPTEESFLQALFITC